MANDDKKTTIDPVSKREAAPKHEAPAKDKSASGGESANVAAGATATATPASYSRGEGQKPVSQAYKDNWNAIFAKKKKR